MAKLDWQARLGSGFGDDDSSSPGTQLCTHMTDTPPTRLASSSQQAKRLRQARIAAHSQRPDVRRRASSSGLTSTGHPKAQRTSKTSQKLVVLPSAPQTKPLADDDDVIFGYETDAGVRQYKSEAERMTKEQRHQAGYSRLTAYCVAESFKMKLLVSFLNREHNISPRVFDEAVYGMYHLPLLPGYGPNANVRSSVLKKAPGRRSIISRLSEAEEIGYQGTYFSPHPVQSSRDGYISSSPVRRKSTRQNTSVSEPLTTADESETETEVERDGPRRSESNTLVKSPEALLHSEEKVAEVVFFEYGVVVFFGLTEDQERAIIEDLGNAGIMRRRYLEADWEIEECHYTHDPLILYPRIYNDFFTLKSHSHLLKISIAHALAQSVELAHFESSARQVLSSPLTLSIPQQLAKSGALQLRRHEALKLTGRLFKLRRDINLVSNVLDVPELFWSEASLKELYDAVREYMEIKSRVYSLNEKLSVAGDFLDAIHDHLNNSAMERITWIIIWLIVVACLVEFGEIVARLVVHATMGKGVSSRVIQMSPELARQDALRVLEKMMAN